MTQAPRFALYRDEVPDPPPSSLWVDLLRWMICVMDPDDRRLSFVAGCLSHAAQTGILSEKQSNACQAILNTICRAWGEGTLVCQNNIPPDDVKLITPTMRKH